MTTAGISPDQRLDELGIVLPDAPPPAAAYVSTVQSGRLLFVSGQVASDQGTLVAAGKVGADVDLDTAIACARQCAVNLIAQLRTGLGSLDRVARVVKLTVFVACDPSFTTPHLVANGASTLIVDVFGDVGRHARSAVGVPVLPLDSPVEVEAIVEVA